MNNKEKTTNLVLRGMNDGIPIGLGYFAVSFSLGITAHTAGITAIQGFVMSLLNNASAGEYAGIAAIKSNSSYIEIALLVLIANARYLLMSCVLSQRLAPKLPLRHRLFLGFDLTDEIFGLSIAYPAPLAPKYIYGAYITTIPCWALGTALGIIAGNILPSLAVKSLSAAIYGMFIAIIVPPSKKNKAILIVIFASFAISGICAILPIISNLSESLRIIILTVLISVAASIIHPVNTDKEELSS